jgi:hypothetical protein
MIQIADSYHNLATYLHIHFRRPVPAVTGHLAAALIRTLTGATGAGESTRAAAADLREFGSDAVLPQDLASMCRQVGDVSGTDLADLILKLSRDPETAEQTLRNLIVQVTALAANSTGDSRT